MFLFIMIPNLLAALLEVVSFVCILLACSQFVQSGPPLPMQQIPFLTSFSHLFSFSSPFRAFIAWILIGIGLQALRSFVSFFSSYLTSTLSLRIQAEAQTR